MSVFTKVERNELIAFLDAYTVGDLQHFQGIRAGIENTNYFVNTSGGRWVLTLFETLPVSELPFCLYLMDHLDAHGIVTNTFFPCSKASRRRWCSGCRGAAR